MVRVKDIGPYYMYKTFTLGGTGLERRKGTVWSIISESAQSAIYKYFVGFDRTSPDLKQMKSERLLNVQCAPVKTGWHSASLGVKAKCKGNTD